MKSQGTNHKIEYSQEDLFNYYLNKILLDWVRNNEPDIVDKAKQFVNAELSNK